jgi:hypothetical protein
MESTSIDNNIECNICIEHIIDEDKYITKCNHIFHKECINKWLQLNNKCPYCRTELTTPLDNGPTATMASLVPSRSISRNGDFIQRWHIIMPTPVDNIEYRPTATVASLGISPIRTWRDFDETDFDETPVIQLRRRNIFARAYNFIFGNFRYVRS